LSDTIVSEKQCPETPATRVHDIPEGSQRKLRMNPLVSMNIPASVILLARKSPSAENPKKEIRV
jgi:hypothetical protein